MSGTRQQSIWRLQTFLFFLKGVFIYFPLPLLETHHLDYPHCLLQISLVQ